MKITVVARLAVCLLLLPNALAIAEAQGTTLRSLLAGTGPEASVAPADLPDGWRAVRIETASIADLMTYGLGLDDRLRDLPSDQRMRWSRAVALSWTDGSQLDIDGVNYLTTYRLGLEDGKDGRPVMRLEYFRTDAIISLRPEPSYTKEMLLAATQQLTPGGGPVSKTTGLSNLKQVALGVMIYASDYDDLMPYVQSTESLKSVVNPYIKNMNLFETLNPLKSRFLMNMAVAGVLVTDVPKPAETPMLFEDKAWPDGTRAVAFMDGSARRVDAAGWAKVAEALKWRFKRTGKPLPVWYTPTPHG